LQIKRAIESAQFSLRNFVFGADKQANGSAEEKPKTDHAK
jgi:hypothetical protein